MYIETLNKSGVSIFELRSGCKLLLGIFHRCQANPVLGQQRVYLHKCSLASFHYLIYFQFFTLQFVFFTGGIVFLTLVLNGSTTQFILQFLDLDKLSAAKVMWSIAYSGFKLHQSILLSLGHLRVPCNTINCSKPGWNCRSVEWASQL